MSNPDEQKEFSSTLFAKMQDVNRSWLERLRAIRDLETEYGTRLMSAKSPSEATTICNEWMAKRLEAVGNEHNAFTVAWLDLVSNTIKSAISGGSAKHTPDKNP